MTHPLTRRRFLALSAAAIGWSALPSRAAPAPAVWRGTALGARASLTLYHPDAARAQDGLRAAVAELRRLENVFSLYRVDSALSRLNQDGTLSAPPLDLVRCLGDAIRFGDITDGAFDVTVQPLWTLYAQHFAAPDAIPSGPAPADIEAARSLVNYRHLAVSPSQITLQRPGMAVTLNGIAQGYITDRVGDVLRRHGFDNVLVNLGEARAYGGKPDDMPWRVGLRDPYTPDRVSDRVSLQDQALATSGGYGTWFDQAQRHHHLFDPQSGQSANRWRAISVLAPDATTADALSTAFMSMAQEKIDGVCSSTRATVVAQHR